MAYNPRTINERQAQAKRPQMDGSTKGKGKPAPRDGGPKTVEVRPEWPIPMPDSPKTKDLKLRYRQVR